MEDIIIKITFRFDRINFKESHIEYKGLMEILGDYTKFIDNIEINNEK